MATSNIVVPGPVQSTSVNALPCTVKHDGPANVSSGFEVEKVGDSTTFNAHFRGRNLEGEVRYTLDFASLKC